MPSKGIIPIATTVDMAGPLTRDTADAMLLYSGLRNRPFHVQPAHIKGLRIGVNTFGMDAVSQSQLGRYQTLLDDLQRDGAEVRQMNHPYSPHQRIIQRCEFREDLEAYLAETSAYRCTLEKIIKGYRAEPEVRMPYGVDILETAMAHSRTLPMYAEAMAERQKARVALLAELKDVDACIMTGDTNAMHFTGMPSIALPLAMADDGTPRGIILYGADEKRLLAAARVVERYCPGVTAPCFT